VKATGSQHDWMFADLTDEDPMGRFGALHVVGSEALDDPRAIPALLDGLERDPSPVVRRIAASGLRYLAARDDVGHALRLAAAEYEDLEVRWEARYALRLAGLPGATGQS
jgi:HEAT repeat protein